MSSRENLDKNEYLLNKIKFKYEFPNDGVINGDTEVLITKMSNDFKIDVANGLVSNIVSKKIRAYCSAIPNSWVSVWEPATRIIPDFVNSTIRIGAGGNANDSVAGLGARKVIVEVLDPNFEEHQIELSLAGALASAPSLIDYNWINGAYVSETGTFSGYNYGDISINKVSSGSTFLQIRGFETLGTASYGNGVAFTPIYCVPANKKLLIKSINWNSSTISANPPADYIEFKIMTFNDTNRNNKIICYNSIGNSGSNSLECDVPIEIPEKTFVHILARNSAVGTNSLMLNMDCVLLG